MTNPEALITQQSMQQPPDNMSRLKQAALDVAGSAIFGILASPLYPYARAAVYHVDLAARGLLTARHLNSASDRPSSHPQ